jgi:NTP pyrophosphatase (non-canonical NTP hydrolase)
MSYKFLELEVIRWAEARGILANSSPQTQLLKTVSELGELADAVIKKDMPAIKDGIGDVMVTLIVVAELLGMDVTNCLEHAYAEIKDRKGQLLPNGTFVKDAS